MVAADIRNLADEEVMQLVGDGSPRAFELLYDRHGGAAFSLAYRMVGDRVDGRGHIAGGVPVDLAQPHALRRRRAAACAPGCSASSTTARSTRCAAARCTSAGASSSRASRSGTRRASGPTSRRPAARRRAACAAPWTTLPVDQRRTIELAYFGGFSHSQIAELARRADRHHQGTDAPWAREAAAPARRLRGRGIRMTTADHTTYKDEVGAYLLGALSDAERASFEGHLAQLHRVPATRSSGCGRRPTCCRARSSRWSRRRA